MNTRHSLLVLATAALVLVAASGPTSAGTAAANRSAAKIEAPSGHVVNINTASAEELARLPGIGEAKAKAIVAYRKKSGKFAQPEDLMKVKGIGEATFLSIRHRIAVSKKASTSK